MLVAPLLSFIGQIQEYNRKSQSLQYWSKGAISVNEVGEGKRDCRKCFAVMS